MRDLLIAAIVFGSIPFIFRNAQIGVLVWSWLGYMNPHTMAFGFAKNFPFAQVIAIVLFVALLFNMKRLKAPPAQPVVILWILLMIWMAISTVFAIFPEVASLQLEKVVKIQVIFLVMLLLMRDKKAVNQMVWVIFLSVGYFGIKGGIFTIQTGGAHRVWGPPSTFIEDNNALAAATLMCIPLGMYLARQLVKKWARVAMYLACLLMLVSAVGSQSRGAFLAILAVAFVYWTKSRHKLVSLIGIVALLPVLFLSMPESWFQRMETIETYEEDASAMGRINAWIYSVNVANERLTGAGFNSWSPETFALWAPDPQAVHAAHSIYFGMLGDNGWIGLLLFVSILMLTFRNLTVVDRIGGKAGELWASDLSKMLKVGMIAYITAGTFLSLSYYDLPWHFIMLSVILRDLAKREGWANRPEVAVDPPSEPPPGSKRGKIGGRFDPQTS